MPLACFLPPLGPSCPASGAFCATFSVPSQPPAKVMFSGVPFYLACDMDLPSFDEEASSAEEILDNEEVMCQAAATAWLRDVAVTPSGIETQPVHVPDAVQDSLLRYYTDTLDELGEGKVLLEDNGYRGRGVGGAPTGVQHGQPPDGPHSGRWDHGEDNYVPNHLAPQSDVFNHDDEMVQPTRVRRLESEALLFQQMQNQLTSSLGVGSLASLGTPFLHATVVAPVFRGGAVADIKRFKVVLGWAAPTPKGLSFMCRCGGECGAFCVETRLKKGESSYCGHADALRRAFFVLAAQTVTAP